MTLDDYNECLNSILDGEQPICEELYNLKDDPLEEFNAVNEKCYRDVLNGMRERLVKRGVELKPERERPLTIDF